MAVVQLDLDELLFDDFEEVDFEEVVGLAGVDFVSVFLEVSVLEDLLLSALADLL